MRTLLFLLFSTLTASAQVYKVTYEKISNGSRIEGDIPIVFADLQKTLVTNAGILNGSASAPFEQTLLFSSEPGTYYLSATLGKGRFAVTKDSTSIDKQRLELRPDRRKILGYECKLAHTVINSNSIDIWYTEAPGVKAGPSILGQRLGLVLETNRNGNFVVRATRIEKAKTFPELPAYTPIIDILSYRDLLWKSRFTTIPLFNQQVLNFSEDASSNDSIFRFGGGSIAVRRVRFPVISPGSVAFVDVTEQSSGDAYDRTGSVFLMPLSEPGFWDALQKGIDAVPVYENGNGRKYQGMVRTERYSPMLELMRFFTPFGVKGYNYLEQKGKVWQDHVYYRQDITDLLPALSGKEVYIGVVIGNYDKGGHTVDAAISIHTDPESEKPGNTKLIPLFNTINVLEMRGQEYGSMFDSPKGLEVKFELPEGARHARLRYITTGHGGWEHGDEFLRKKNTIFLDGKEVFAFVPWKTDCGSYRLSNPASGNFENGLSSSDYSRSNWCPGTTTNPIWIELGDLAPGSHTLQVTIPMGTPEGGSFSAWNVSGVLEYD